MAGQRYNSKFFECHSLFHISFNTKIKYLDFFCFFFNFFFYLFVYFWLCWVFVSVRGLSLIAASGATLHRGARASHYRGLSLWSTGSRCTGSVVVAHGPCCSVACGILPDQGSNPCPLHWQADSQPLHHQGSPKYLVLFILQMYFSSLYKNHSSIAFYLLDFFKFQFLGVNTFLVGYLTKNVTCLNQNNFYSRIASSPRIHHDMVKTYLFNF